MQPSGQIVIDEKSQIYLAEAERADLLQNAKMLYAIDNIKCFEHFYPASFFILVGHILLNYFYTTSHDICTLLTTYWEKCPRASLVGHERIHTGPSGLTQESRGSHKNFTVSWAWWQRL